MLRTPRPPDWDLGRRSDHQSLHVRHAINPRPVAAKSPNTTDKPDDELCGVHALRALPTTDRSIFTALFGCASQHSWTEVDSIPERNEGKFDIRRKEKTKVAVGEERSSPLKLWYHKSHSPYLGHAVIRTGELLSGRFSILHSEREAPAWLDLSLPTDAFCH
jgi:hypothetical protein